MGKDVLSQNEVDSLLGSPDVSDPPSNDLSSQPSPTLSDLSIDSQCEKVVTYNFKRPERVGKKQMRALRSMHEGFGRNLGASLSALLRSVIEVKLVSVDQLTYSEFVFSLENPSCFNLLDASPLEGKLILDISPSILYPIIDRMLGGGKDRSPPTRRPLTEIELRLVRRITDLFLRKLKHAWGNVIELDLAVDRVESNPQLVQVVPPNEVVVLICFELSLSDLRGMLNLCIPFNSIEHISSKLTANPWVNFGQRDLSDSSQEIIGRQMERAVVEVIVELAEAKITTADLVSLRVGDIITTDQACHGQLPVLVEGVRKYYARPGAIKGRKAFQVEAVTDIPTTVEGQLNEVTQATKEIDAAIVE